MGAFSDLTGSRFGSLVVLRGSRSQGRWHWMCSCDCGEITAVISRALTRSDKPTVSCGCLIKKMLKLNSHRFVTHGHTVGGIRSRPYSIWQNMLDRCYRASSKAFDCYGGRGIYVEANWHVFENFFADMGEPPDGMSLERLDNNGPYSKGNCVWATPKQQARNTRRTRRVTYLGQTKSLVEWCEELELGYYTVHSRITKLGWSVEKALEQGK